MAQVDNVFQANTTGRWTRDSLWSRGHEPEADEHAIIPGTSTCRIPEDYEDAVAQKITVQGGEAGNLVMKQSSALDVGEDITVEDDAELTMEKWSELTVGDDIKLEEGAEMVMEDNCDADVRFITVEDDAALFVQDCSELTLGEDDPPNTSTVLGLLEIGGPGANDGAKLFIAGDHTIQGPGGEIFVYGDSCVDPAPGEDPTLTLASECIGYQSPDCAVLMHGGGCIKVRLDNDAIVRADLSSGTKMWLHVKPKEGSGLWSAQGNGELWVSIDLKGSADWLLSDVGEDPEPQIVINHCLWELTGSVLIKAGRFHLGDRFCTTGDITWDSTNYESTIIGSPVRTSIFGGVCDGTMCPP